jgi:hypothetical protein
MASLQKVLTVLGLGLPDVRWVEDPAIMAHQTKLPENLSESWI